MTKKRDPSCDERCFYCLTVLAGRHEHDHFPIPARHGGTSTVCACMNCHELKDRERTFENTSFVASLPPIWEKLTTEQRIFLARVICICLDNRVEPRVFLDLT